MLKLSNIIKGLTLEQYERYVFGSPCRIKELIDLRKLGTFPLERWQRYQVDDDHAIFTWVGKNEDKIVKPGDWTYYINKYLFRDQWNLESTKPKIGFFGCSFTFGEGVKSEDTFVQKVAKETNLEPFNFGAGGASIQRIARTFSAATNLIDLEYAVITFPAWHRQLFTNAEGHSINLIPGWPHDGFEDILDKLADLPEDYYVVQAVSFVNWIYDVAKSKNIKLILSSWDHPMNDICRVMYPENTIMPFPNIDDKKARDKMHPGPLSHNSHALQIINKINDRTWISK